MKWPSPLGICSRSVGLDGRRKRTCFSTIGGVDITDRAIIFLFVVCYSTIIFPFLTFFFHKTFTLSISIHCYAHLFPSLFPASFPYPALSFRISQGHDSVFFSVQQRTGYGAHMTGWTLRRAICTTFRASELLMTKLARFLQQLPHSARLRCSGATVYSTRCRWADQLLKTLNSNSSEIQPAHLHSVLHTAHVSCGYQEFSNTAVNCSVHCTVGFWAEVRRWADSVSKYLAFISSKKI